MTNIDWSQFTPVDSEGKPLPATKNGAIDWSRYSPVKPDETGDTMRGFKESFQQLPQLGYGLLAGAGAAGEAAFGEGGIATGIKKAAVAGYQDWGNRIASKAKDSDSWDYSYDQAKQGNIGALVDWLQHGIGYVGGQGVQMLMTAGIGSVAGKFVAATAAKQIAEGMVAKSAAELAATEAGAKLSAAELTEAATANVAGKFAAIGQNSAVGAMGFGQEGGEIFGDLSKKSVDEGRSLSGAELGKAFAASLAAGALEFVGDKIGLDVILGKSALLKPAEHMGGIGGRLARGGIAAAAETPIEAGTEYLQTGLENYGKGNEENILPFNQSEAAQKDARESAMLGALGGTVIGGAGGMLHGAKQVAAPVVAPAVTPEAPGAPLAIGNTPDPLIAFPDGTVGRKADVDAYVAGLPPEQRHAARSALMGQTPFVDPIEKIGASQSVDEAISAATEAVNKPLDLPDVDESALSPFMRRAPGVTQERDIAGIKLDADMAQQLQQREAEIDAIGGTAPEARAEFDAQQDALKRAATVEAPSAMELALRRAAPVAQDETTPTPAEPRIVARTPDMQPTSLPKAQAQADAIGGEVARVQNQSGKFAYVALPASQKEIQPGDLLTGDGKPYGSLIAAKVRARKDGGDVVAVTGGWLVRPKPAEDVTPIAPAVPAAAPAATTEATTDERTAVPAATEPATGDRSGPADDAGSVAADGRLDAVPAPDVPAGNAAAAGEVGNAGVGSRVDDAAVAPVLSTKTNKDGTVMVLGKPADIQAALPNVKGVAGKRGVMYGKRQAASVQKAVDAFNKNGPAAKPVKVKRRRTVDPERDTLLQAVAKYGGIDREEVAREFGLKPEELQHVVPAGNLKAYPFRKSGGMSIDGATEALREDGYLDGVPHDELRRTLEEAILAEIGGSPRLSTTGQMRQANERGAEDAAEQQANAEADAFSEADQHELDAIVSTTEGLRDIQRLDDDDLLSLDTPGETDPATIMRALGFTEQEIQDDLAAQAAEQAGKTEAGPRAGQDAGGQAQAPDRTGSEAPRGDAALTLTAPTPEELQAKATAEAKAQAADKAEQKRLADKAKADSERGEFTLTGSDSASDVAAAAGQDDLFSAPTPATQAAEILDAANITGKDRIDAIKDVKAGTITADELKAAYPAKGAKIDDFGEKLLGARKDYAATLKDALSVDVAAEPLSKSWPEPDYQKLLDAGAKPFVVAWVHAARDQIPTKPMKGWKLSGWVATVKVLREASAGLLDGATTEETLRSQLTKPEFRNVAATVGGRADLYAAVGHEKSLKGINFEQHHYSVYRGETNVDKWVIDQKAKATAFGNWPREIVAADSKADAIAQFKAKVGTLETGSKAKAQPQFDIYRKRNAAGAFIGKKIGREFVDLKKFADVAEARAYLADNKAALEQALAKYKETPFERNAENQPRVGDDHRNGAAVTPEVFADTFGFRGVQFGNYVEQGRRQSDLNQTFDALMDLAAVLGVPAKALSLGGRLGLAFGARGKGGINAPAAHFEPNNIVINLTKGDGPGSLAHEFWHGLDNYFARQGEGENSVSFVTGGAKTDGIREQMRAAFKAVQQATQQATLRERSAELDKRRSKPYWDTPVELSARAFESYVIAKLQDQNASNDYLANVVSPEFWDALEAMRLMALDDEGKTTYPYPMVDEMPKVRAAFDEFFQTVEANEGDDGKITLAHQETAREDAPSEYGDPPAEESAKVEAGLKGKTLLQAADWIAEHAPPELGLIVQQARKQLARLQLAGAKFTFQIANRGDDVPRLLMNARGITSYEFGQKVGKGEIGVWLNGADVVGKVGVSYETAAHEIIHAATMAAVRLGNLKSQEGTELAKHVADLYAVTKHVRTEFNKRVTEYQAGERILTPFETRMFAKMNNAFADVNETITWALTDKDAQTFLESIEYKGKTAWTAFVQVVRSLLGLSPKADTALSEILRISEELLNDETHTLTEGMLSRDGKDTVMQRGMTDMTLPHGDSTEQTETPAFKRWFGESKVVGEDGKPLVVYHGTTADFDAFKPETGWFTAAPSEAGLYGGMGAEGAQVMPAFVSIKQPRVIDGDKTPNWRSAVFDALTDSKIDGVIVTMDGKPHWVVPVDAAQIKSAIGNNGDFDPTSSIITAHQSTGATAGQPSNRDRIADKLRNAGGGPKIIGNTGRAYTPTQLAAMRAVGFQVQAPTLEERAKAVWKDAGKKLAQGLVDQFAPIKEISSDAYSLLRLAKGASGAFEAMLQGGKLKLSDGVYDFDETQRGGVVDTLLKPLGGEHHDFFRWVAANRAERLLGEGKEHLFTPEDIKALKTLADGTSSFDYELQHGAKAGIKTRDRSLIYADALKTFNGFNKNVLDLAEQSGLIDGESRKLWEHEFYVPFYRVAEDEGGGIGGVNIKGGAVRQQAFKQLKGGKQALNADLMDNTLMNWAHLLDASAKNRAAVATLAAAENMGVAISAPESTAREMANSISQKGNVVWVMDGGQKHFYVVEDPYVMTALTSLEYAGMRSPIMKALGTFKHALTLGVTASPFFKVRNLIRDSVQAIGSAPLSYNVAQNLAEGWKLTDPKSDAYFRLLAGGGTIHFGTQMEGSEGKRVQALVEAGVDASTILDGDQKVKAFYRKFIEPSITAYNELGNRGEAINRAALYAQLRKQGMNHMQASLQARDLMDFSMQGSFNSVRFLTQVVPFFNARLQGLYKLGRAAKEDPARISTVIGAAALAGLGLMLAYSDDDDWRKREDFDRNNFWWFKFGGTAFRIPKPFEVGAIATLAERGFEYAFDKEMDGKRFRANVLALLSDNLSMNPIPQLAKPLLDVYANKDGFTGRPIETMGMEKLKADYRFTSHTSMAARGISTAANAVSGLVGAQTLSPVQVDSLLRGYFGWLGSFVVGAGDVIARPLTGQATQPDSDLFKAATGGMLSDLRDAPSRYVSQVYAQATEIEQAYTTWKSLAKEGKTEEAAEFLADNKADISKYKLVEKLKKTEGTLNQQIKRIEQGGDSGQTKRERIRDLLARKDQVARVLAGT